MRRFLLVLCCLAVLMPVSPQSRQQQPTFRVGVNFIRVDVYPTLDGRIVPDLTRDEFEVLEDGVPQRIETFERVVIRAPGAEAERAEPRSVEQSNEAAADSRNRLFVLFLDSYHTTIDATRTRVAGGVGTASTRASAEAANSRIGRALATFLGRLIGPDDLIAVTRPEMPVDSLSFTRRPASFEQLLLEGGAWQRRPVADDLYSPDDLDEIERGYLACYPHPQEAVAYAMIARRRERIVLSALRSLVRHLQTLREERKAILVVSEGWRLFGPDSSLLSAGGGPQPSAIGIAGGQPAIGDPRTGSTSTACDRDRAVLADIDDRRDFRDLLDEANRSNASFYPIDPRGLPVFDSAVPSAGQSVGASLNLLRDRLDSLQTLAGATDGLAILNSNNFTKNLQRISDDLSSYYLLGYNSTNAKFDGKFRKITVRVKRPGVSVRARPGYNAPTEAEVAARSKAAMPRDPVEDLRTSALASLGTERSDRPLHIAAGYGFDVFSEGQSPHPALWVVGELDAATARTLEWSGGGEATITVAGPDGQTMATENRNMTAANPRFALQVSDPRLKAGDYLVKVRLQAAASRAASESGQVRVPVPDRSASAANTLGQPMLFRRGPYSAAGFQPTADLRFRRAERVRVDVPVAIAPETIAARLLDRRGQVMSIPVTSGQREDGARRFITAEIALAPLAPADYLVELSVQRGNTTEKMLTAFRIVP